MVGITPLVIQLPESIPTSSRIRMAGNEALMVCTMPCMMSAHRTRL